MNRVVGVNSFTSYKEGHRGRSEGKQPSDVLGGYGRQRVFADDLVPHGVFESGGQARLPIQFSIQGLLLQSPDCIAVDHGLRDWHIQLLHAGDDARTI